jgi:hypothetical protein
MMLLQENIARKNIYQPSVVSPLFHGICSACVHAAQCSYLQDEKHLVLHCGEFMPDSRKADQPMIRIIPLRLQPESRQESGVAGLCRTCVKFSGCTFPKTEAGSLFCNEFSG